MVLNSNMTSGNTAGEFLLRLDAAAAWQRLDACLGQALAGRLSREKIKKAILQGDVKLNGQICQSPKTKVGPGGELRLLLPEVSQLPQAEEGPLDILYQDADLAVINKPAGLTVHPCPSCPAGTLVNRLLAHFPALANIAACSEESAYSAYLSGAEDSAQAEDAALADQEFFPAQSGDRPGIVHRLDKDTTGLLLVALNEGARLKLTGFFAAREVKKEYLALVYGVPAQPEGVIDVPIGRDPQNKTRMTVFAGAAATAASRFGNTGNTAGRSGGGRDRMVNPGSAAYSHVSADVIYGDATSRPGNAGGGRDALSEYRTLYSDPLGLFSLLAVRIHTGRTHQVRVHLRYLGHPIIGDAAYFDYRAIRPVLEPFLHDKPEVLENGQSLRDFTRLLAIRPLLHAWKISLPHPQILETKPDSYNHSRGGSSSAAQVLEAKPTGVSSGFQAGNVPDEAAELADGSEIAFHCPPPEDFYACLSRLALRTQPVVLTGNVGCGKSSVLAALAQRGIPVWSADKVVADLYRPGQGGWHMLRSAFGRRFVADSQAEVNKKALFAAMCEDERLRREVEKLIHPLAAQALRDFFAQRQALPGLPALDKTAAAPLLAVAEVPLFFEAGWANAAPCAKAQTAAGQVALQTAGRDQIAGPACKTVPNAHNSIPNSFPLTLGIHCPREVRAGRLRLNRGWPDAMIEKMESWQWAEEKKMSACDVVLDNSGSLEELDDRIEAALQELADLRTSEVQKVLDTVRNLVS